MKRKCVGIFIENMWNTVVWALAGMPPPHSFASTLFFTYLNLKPVPVSG